MLEYIRELLGLADDELDEIRDLHAFWVPKIVVGFDLLLLVGFLLNWGGLMRINLVFAWIAASVAIILATRPEGPAIATSLGALSGATQEQQPATPNQTARPNTILSEAGRFLKVYAQWSAGVLFWTSGILFLLGTIPVEGNPGSALVILTGAIVVFSYVIYKKKKLSIASWLIYTYVCLLIIVSFMKLVPWADLVGIDIFGTRADSVGMSSIEKKEHTRSEKAKKTFLAEVERKVSDTKTLEEVIKELPPKEKELYEKLKAENDERSFFKKVSHLFEHREAEAKPAPPEPVRVAVLPAAPPPPPAPTKRVVPKKAEKPEWELCVENKNIYAHRDWDCYGAAVAFKDDHREIEITYVYGNKVVYRGFSSGVKGSMKGYWNVRAPGWDPRHLKFQLKFANKRWEYASGWREHENDERFKLVLKRTYMPPGSPEEEQE